MEIIPVSYCSMRHLLHSDTKYVPFILGIMTWLRVETVHINRFCQAKTNLISS